MSRFSKQLCKQLVTLARQGRGSYKTVADRSRIAERFSERLSDLNIQIRDVKHIKTSHVEKYMESRKTENLSLRTLQNEMSRFSKQLCKQLVTLARQGRGSYKTVADRSRIAERFSERLSELNIQIRDVKHIKTSHIEKYIESRKADSLSLRTLQNEMSAIRSVLLSAGRNKLADPSHLNLSNQALGISGANRDGTKLPITDEKLNAVVSFAQKKDEGVALAVQLSRYLGLRTEETVQSAKSLKTWKQALINNHERVRVVFGTKGGRPRETTVFNREKVLSILDKAIHYVSEHNGKLIDKPSLHTAIDRYRNIVREAGMNGKNAPHSLRYAYSRDAVNHHIKNGMSRDEAEALVSMDLGHGDGRGRYIKQVYFREETE